MKSEFKWPEKMFEIVDEWTARVIGILLANP